ncbi:MAG: Gfo/Idh/MocA family oxidoreductase [Bacteroidales bacterium]|jgi:predicted dehydrogenase|nr:Gfo/Idh/MocA family oxidoreductase [Bacteroidales bacterium]
MNRKLRMGMVGGGSDAFIGAIHRLAAFMDNQIELVCGCFSVNPEISISSGKSYFLPENRVYKTYQEMFENEVKLPEGERMDFVTIVTPNVFHFEPAMMALERGFHVVVDKPITFSLEQAKQLKAKVEETGLILALTHTYSGFPAVKEAKERIARGDIGKVRKVYVEYPQGWLATRIELAGGNNAGWRTDPKSSGKAGAMGDIGTHAWHLAEYISGLKVTELCAEIKAFAPGRPIDDDGAALLRFDNGATGVLMASQIAVGEENAIAIRVYGEKGGLEWHQQEPNTLLAKWLDRPTEVIRVGTGYLSDFAKFYTRTPGGHPEGYVEAFANIYRNFSYTVRAKINGEKPDPQWLDFPTVNDGLRGMQFIETIVTAGYDDSKKWVQWVQ